MSISKYIRRYSNPIFLSTFIIVSCGGIIRKWTSLPGIITSVIVLATTCAPFLLILLNKERNRLKLDNKYKNILIIYGTLLLLQAFNPLNLTLFHGIFGFIIHFSFWYTIFYYLPNRAAFNIKELISIFIIISFIQVGIGLIQYYSEPDSIWNQTSSINEVINYDEFEEEKDATVDYAFVGTAIRANGLFSYMGGMFGYMIFHFFLTFATIILRYPKTITSLLLVIGLIGALITGSRAVTLIYLIATGAFFIFQLKRKEELIMITLSLSALLFINLILNDPIHINKSIANIYENFIARVDNNSSEAEERIMAPINTLFFFDKISPYFGIGLGSTYPGINSIFGTSPYVANTPVEHEIGRTLTDGGYILLFFKFFLYATLIRALNLNRLFSLIVLGTTFLALLITTNIYVNYYLLLGIMLLDQAILYSEQTKPFTEGPNMLE